MALEINEIGIRLREAGKGDAAGASLPPSGNESSEPAEPAPAGIVAACVRRVRQLLTTLQGR